MRIDYDEVARTKERYPAGTCIRIEYMNDPRPVPPGTEGIVRLVDDMGTIHCDFKNGRRLGVIPGEDSFYVISKEEYDED